MASLQNTNKNIIPVSKNIILHVGGDNFGNFYVYTKDNKGYLLNGNTSKDLIKYLRMTKQGDIAEEILDTLINVLMVEDEN